jgi:hypothetical protein
MLSASRSWMHSRSNVRNGSKADIREDGYPAATGT